MPGVTEASMARTSASGRGHRTSFQTGVVSRQMNRATRNQVRYQGSSRVMSMGCPSTACRNSGYAVSNTT